MTEQTLRDLADAGVTSVAAPPFLAERVLALHLRSRRRRRLGASLALSGLVAGGAMAARSGGESRFYSVDEPSFSMAPTVTVDEHVILDRTLAPSRGDLVEVTVTNAGQRFETIRRVIGLPGDVIACPAAADGYCHGWSRNGEVLSEPYIGRDQGSPGPTSAPQPGFFIDRGDNIAPYAAVTVTSGHFFELGDNRDNAVDSRSYGLAKLSGVRGVGVQIIGTDGHARAIPGAPQHQVPGPGGTIDPPAPLPSTGSQPVVTRPRR
jgi:signal peptidase I